MVYSEKILDHAKQSATGTLNTSSKRVIQKTAEATGDFIGNKIVKKLQKIQRIQNKKNSEILKMSMMKKYLKNNIYL